MPKKIVKRACITALVVVFVFMSLDEAWSAPVHTYPRVISAEIKGLVLYADGETPASRVPIRVYDIERREFTLETETNENGLYKLSKLDPGEYFITYDWTKLRVTLVENGGTISQQPHDIIIVIPQEVGMVSMTHMGSVLFAATLTESARRMEETEDIPPVVSP